jgi:hypothetical protein
VLRCGAPKPLPLWGFPAAKGFIPGQPGLHLSPSLRDEAVCWGWGGWESSPWLGSRASRAHAHTGRSLPRLPRVGGGSLMAEGRKGPGDCSYLWWSPTEGTIPPSLSSACPLLVWWVLSKHGTPTMIRSGTLDVPRLGLLSLRSVQVSQVKKHIQAGCGGAYL